MKYNSYNEPRLYSVWNGMKHRCYKTNDVRYESYGGRGIEVCEEWKNNFSCFAEWAYKNGYNKNAKRGDCTLDRIDANGNYCPENCRFVSMKIQSRNKTNNAVYTYNGETHTLVEWSEIFGIKSNTLRARIERYNWSFEDALSKPIGESCRKNLDTYNKHNGNFYSYNGEEHNLKEWAKIMGISYSALQQRIKKFNYTFEEAITKPVRRYKNNV